MLEAAKRHVNSLSRHNRI